MCVPQKPDEPDLEVVVVCVWTVNRRGAGRVLIKDCKTAPIKPYLVKL